MSIDIVVYDTSHENFTGKGALTALTQGLQWGGNEASSLTLFSDGCWTDSGTTNCTATCLVPSRAFTDIFNFGNCLAYPWISQFISSGNLTTGAQAIANRFSILSNTTYPGVTTAIVQIQNKCWNQWVTHAVSSLFSPDSPQWSELCGGDYSSIGNVNTDIGGIGISVSYWMQCGIAIGAFLLLQCLDSWIYHLYFVGLRRFKGLGLKAAKKKALDFQKKWIDRHLKILLIALVEFQKAQCFFILPVQAAALAALSGVTTILTPTTPQQYLNHRYLFELFGISGMLPVMLILFTLHGAGQKSWYLLGMSTIAVAISAATVLQVTSLPSLDFSPGTRYSACAYQDTTTLCFSFDFEILNDEQGAIFVLAGGYVSIMTLSLVVLAILTLDFLWNPEKPAFVPIRDWLIHYIDQQKIKYATQPERVNGKPMTSTRLERIQLKLGRDWAKKFVRVVYSLMYSVVWAFLLLYLGEVFSTWASLTSDTEMDLIETRTWSFGQIVAVTIWAAPLCEWVYLEFRGLEEGSKYRIPKPFRVIEEEDSEVIVQHLERDGSSPKSVAQILLSKLGYFRRSSSGSIAHHQALNRTGDVALQPIGAAGNSHTPPNLDAQPSGSRTRPSGSQTQPSGSHARPPGSQTQLSGSQTQHSNRTPEGAVERKIALAILRGYSEQEAFFDTHH